MTPGVRPGVYRGCQLEAARGRPSTWSDWPLAVRLNFARLAPRGVLMQQGTCTVGMLGEWALLGRAMLREVSFMGVPGGCS